MTGPDTTTTVGPLPNATAQSRRVPRALTRLAWLLWAASLAVLVGFVRADGPWTWGPFVVDGLTVLLWTVATFFGAVVHSYARRYVTGDPGADRFFVGVFGFTLAVAVLVAADSLALFVAAWVAMGLAMADLIGHAEGWPQARAAARRSRRSFLAGGALLAVACAALWWGTGATTVSGVAGAAATLPTAPWLVAAGALLLAAALQSALVPVHGWLVASMTAPTPASALMHAGFVNAGGVLLVRFAPVVAADERFMTLVLVVGATGALLGKLLKTVATDVKRQLACSTAGQMGFMVAQVGLGFFGAAVAHLVLHGCYKAYQFLSAGDRVERTSPEAASPGTTGPVELAVTGLSALAGGGLFAFLTGKGTSLDAGLLLTLVVVLTTLHATRTVLRRADLPATLRYGAIPLVFLPAVALYAAVYAAVVALLAGLPVVTQPTALTPVHGAVALAFVAAYIGTETGAYRRSRRLYVTLLNMTQPPADTVLTATEEYRES
ncbi:MAG: proton-conducting transporter membrane subunit [Haloferacaceae archaeon]